MDLIKTILLSVAILSTIPASLSLTIGDRSVIVLNVTANWYQAHELCSAFGMQLLILRNIQENLEAIRIANLYKINIWLGGSILGGGKWTWLATGEEITYLPWALKEPTGGGEQCLERSTGFTSEILSWNDISCVTKQSVICQETDAKIQLKKLEVDVQTRLEKANVEQERIKEEQKIIELKAQKRISLLMEELEDERKKEPLKCPEIVKEVKPEEKAPNVHIHTSYVVVTIVVCAFVLFVFLSRRTKRSDNDINTLLELRDKAHCGY